MTADEAKTDVKPKDKDPLSGLKFQLPDWFLTDYVRTSTEIRELDSKIAVTKEKSTEEKASKDEDSKDEKSEGKDATIDSYEIPEKMYAELRDTAAFGLIARGKVKPQLDAKDASVIIESASSTYCNHVVQHLAKDFDAHLVVINMDVLGELAIEFDRQEMQWLADNPKPDDEQSEESAGNEESNEEGESDEKSDEENVEEGDEEKPVAGNTDQNSSVEEAGEKNEQMQEATEDTEPPPTNETSDAQPTNTASDDSQINTESTPKDQIVVEEANDNEVVEEDVPQDGTITPSDEWVMTEGPKEEDGQQETPQDKVTDCDEQQEETMANGGLGEPETENSAMEEKDDTEKEESQATKTTHDGDEEKQASCELETASKENEESQGNAESAEQAEESNDAEAEADGNIRDDDSDDLSDDVPDPSSRNHSEINLDERYSDQDSLVHYYFSARCKKHSPRDVFSRTRRALVTILRAADTKLNSTVKIADAEETPAEDLPTEGARPVFLLIEDAFDMRFKSRGQKMLKNMHIVTQRLREKNTPALIFAINSKSSSKVGKKLQAGAEVLHLNPECLERYAAAFKDSEAQRQTKTNVKHIKFGLRKNFPDDFCADFMALDTQWDLTHLGKEALSDSQLKRILKQATGHGLRTNSLDLAAIQEVVTRIIGEEEKSEDENSKTSSIVERIREDCSEAEQTLLDRVIDKEKITVSFEDVVMDEDAKKAIKYLVSISKIRFEASSKELLERCNISGALLYGPPGTGKTHLARAVAKHSGSHMLAISGADIESKWVGETEEAIQAAFSLAKKLSPCVLFIDEADALLHRRSSCGERAYVRKALNQFLQEMDGITSDRSSTFVLCATNRPMDIDEAFLRRLPHGVKLSLPTEAQRRAIFDVLLKGPDLSPSVDLDALARATKGYSGSDLRSICGEAIILFAMETVDIMEQSDKKDEAVTLLLEHRHFTKAMTKIGPSVTARSMENMETFSKMFKGY